MSPVYAEKSYFATVFALNLHDSLLSTLKRGFVIHVYTNSVHTVTGLMLITCLSSGAGIVVGIRRAAYQVIIILLASFPSVAYLILKMVVIFHEATRDLECYTELSLALIIFQPFTSSCPFRLVPIGDA
jgi:hypothetical protein